MDKITLSEFRKRLATLCLKRGGRGLPRRRRDQHILFLGVTLVFDRDRSYSAKETNSIIQTWSTDVGPAVEIDHVTLRRHLVDEGYLMRDPAGAEYEIGANAGVEWFETEVFTIDPVGVVAEAQAMMDSRRLQYMAGKDDDN